MLKLVTHPDSFLRQPTTEVNKFNRELKDFCFSLTEAMLHYDGIGLAANQVGDSRKIFVIHKDVSKTPDHLVFINPTILNISEEKRLCLEGCLSLPGLNIKLVRPHRTAILARHTTGIWFNVNGFGLYSQALQHELDHLNGKLLIDYLK